MSLYRRAVQRDANEEPIVAALAAAGCTIARLSGSGLPDLLVGLRGANWLLEVKLPLGPRGGASDHQHLNERQVEWHRGWKGQVAVVRTPLEALVAVGAVKP